MAPLDNYMIKLLHYIKKKQVYSAQQLMAFLNNIKPSGGIETLFTIGHAEFSGSQPNYATFILAAESLDLCT